MEKSTAYIAITAVDIVTVCVAGCSGTKNSTISFVKPNVRRQKADSIEPSTMKGLRRPHFDVDSSANAPTMGCTMRPESGPAIQTKDVLLFVRPRERR